MGFKQQLASVAIGLFTITALLVIIYFFLVAIVSLIGSTNSEVTKGVLAAGVSAILAVATVVLGKIWEQKIKIQNDIRDKKIPLYEKQIETFYNLMLAEKLGQRKMNEKELAKAFADFSWKLLIWGQPKVIKAWEKFKNHNWENQDPIAGMFALEDFLRILREDVGASNEGLEKGALLRTFITDLDATKLPPGSKDAQ